MKTFMSQYWLTKVEWDTAAGAYMKCAVASFALLQFFDEQGYEDLFFVQVLGGKNFDPDFGLRIGERHYHTMARVGNLYIDLTYRQFEGQEDSDWPLILDINGVESLWAFRNETSYHRGLDVSSIVWEELTK